MKGIVSRRTVLISISLCFAALLWTNCFISEITERVFAWDAHKTDTQTNKPIPAKYCWSSLELENINTILPIRLILLAINSFFNYFLFNYLQFYDLCNPTFSLYLSFST
ncbi:hypothetical protein SATMO3_36750 [Sporomusa aerivorans]